MSASQPEGHAVSFRRDSLGFEPTESRQLELNL